MELNYKEPIEISADTFWVGKREGELLERNIYLRVFRGGGKQINMLIDPGPPSDLQVLTEKTSKIIRSIKNVNLIFINHQDPDVAYNASSIQKLNPNSIILSSEDSIRLIHFYGLDLSKLRAIESFKNLEIALITGHKLKFVPSPYCHFRGAVMLYDPETRILFSGDLFGGLSYNQSLFAKDGYLEGIKIFHQIYMPTKEGLKYAIENIKNLEPPPLFIAPQHGSIISFEKVKEAIEFLENLDVGLDLYLKRQEKENYLGAINELLKEVKNWISKNDLKEILMGFKDSTFTSMFGFAGDEITEIKVDYDTALDFLAKNVRILLPPEKIDLFDLELVKILTKWGLPVPKLTDTKEVAINLFEED